MFVLVDTQSKRYPQTRSSCPFSQGQAEASEGSLSRPREGVSRGESACPFLAAQERLKALSALAGPVEENSISLMNLSSLSANALHDAAQCASSATPGATTLALANSLGVEFRKEGRGLDVWRKKWKPVSPKRALELVSKYKPLQARQGEGKWSTLNNMADLQMLVHEAKRISRGSSDQDSTRAVAQNVAAGVVGGPAGVGLAACPALGKDPDRVGLLSFARGMVRHYDNPLSFLKEFHAKHGRAFEVGTPTHGNFLFDTRTDNLVEALAQTDGKEELWEKSPLQTHGASFLIGKKNMFASGGEDWKVINDSISPHLRAKNIRSPEMLEKLTGIFDDHISELKKRVSTAPEGRLEIDARSEMQTAVLDVAMQLFFSTKLPKHSLRDLQEAFNTQMSWLPEETINPTEVSLAKLPGNKKLRDAYKTLDQAADTILQQRKSTTDKPNDMLDSILATVDPETGKPFSEQRIKHEILSLLQAGHETTATMLGWSVLMMAQNPEEYEALQNEVDTTVGSAAPTVDQLKEVKRADNIINETLRLYPPFYLFMRQAKEDTTLGEGNHKVQVAKGTTLVSSLYEMNRHEETWGKDSTGFFANEFHPDRFSEKPPERFIPFGAGKRSCAGRVLGLLEGSLMLTRMAQTFDIEPSRHPIEMNSDLSIHPKDGKVTLSLRSKDGISPRV